MMPTAAPPALRAMGRLTATVDLPTPPLPDETAMVCLTSGMRSGGRPGGAAGAGLVVWAPPIFTWTLATPGTCPTAFEAWLCRAAFAGGGWVVNASVNDTSPSWTWRSWTIPRVTMSFWSAGSLTPRSASRMACSLTIGATIPHRPWRAMGRDLPTLGARRPTTPGDSASRRRDISTFRGWNTVCVILAAAGPSGPAGDGHRNALPPGEGGPARVRPRLYRPILHSRGRPVMKFR